MKPQLIVRLSKSTTSHESPANEEPSKTPCRKDSQFATLDMVAPVSSPVQRCIRFHLAPFLRAAAGRDHPRPLSWSCPESSENDKEAPAKETRGTRELDQRESVSERRVRDQ